MDLTEIRKNNLIENILRQYKLLYEYENTRDLSNDPKRWKGPIEKLFQLEYLSKVTLKSIDETVAQRNLMFHVSCFHIH